MATCMNPRARTRTRGMALPTSLLVLVVLTLLGTAAVFTASTEIDIAGNGRQNLNAQSVAEAGLHEALSRLNSKAAPAPMSIAVGVDGGGLPVSTWQVRLRNASTLGANERQTLTGATGSSTVLPIDTTITYKLEDANERPPRCSGGCDGEVVRFHTSFGYSGPNVPGVGLTGPPVLKIQSTYTDVIGTSKTLTVDAVRSITQASTPGVLRSCGPVTCQQTNKGYLDPTDFPGGIALAAPSVTGCTGTSFSGGTSTAVGCTGDIFLQTFGITMEQAKQDADILATAPYSGPPSGTVGKLIYIQGLSPASSTWNGNQTLGSPEKPVIVVVEGDFQANGNLQVYGVVYVKGSLTGTGNMKVNGAVVVEGTTTLNLTGSGCAGGGSPTSCTARWDPTVISNLNRLSPFTMLRWETN